MNIKSVLKYFLVILFIVIFGKLTENNVLFPRFNNSYSHRFQKAYTDKEKELNQIMLELSDIIEKNHSKFPENANLVNYTGLLSKNGLAVYIYENDSLMFWSDNTVPIANRFSKSAIDSSFVYLRNAWYVPTVKSNKNIKIVFERWLL